MVSCCGFSICQHSYLYVPLFWLALLCRAICLAFSFSNGLCVWPSSILPHFSGRSANLGAWHWSGRTNFWQANHPSMTARLSPQYACKRCVQGINHAHICTYFGIVNRSHRLNRWRIRMMAGWYRVIHVCHCFKLAVRLKRIGGVHKVLWHLCIFGVF